MSTASVANSWQDHERLAMELSHACAGAEQLQEGIDQTSAQLQQAADQAPEIAADLVQQVSTKCCHSPGAFSGPRMFGTPCVQSDAETCSVGSLLSGTTPTQGA